MASKHDDKPDTPDRARACRIAAVVCAIGAVTYTVLYVAFAARNPHLGFSGDYEAAASSCASAAALFTLLAAAASVAAAARAPARDARAVTRRGYGDAVHDSYAHAVLPGAHGLRRR